CSAISRNALCRNGASRTHSQRKEKRNSGSDHALTHFRPPRGQRRRRGQLRPRNQRANRAFQDSNRVGHCCLLEKTLRSTEDSACCRLRGSLSLTASIT